MQKKKVIRRLPFSGIRNPTSLLSFPSHFLDPIIERRRSSFSPFLSLPSFLPSLLSPLFYSHFSPLFSIPDDNQRVPKNKSMHRRSLEYKSTLVYLLVVDIEGWLKRIGKIPYSPLSPETKHKRGWNEENI